MQNTCATCLSQDRRLVPLKSINFKDISLESLNMDFIPIESAVCWECSAAVGRYARFRRRATRAQDVLEYAHTEFSEPVKCLSTLSIQKQDSIHINPTDKDVKPENEIHNLEQFPQKPGSVLIKTEDSDGFSDNDLEEPMIDSDRDTEKLFVEVPIVKHRTKRGSELDQIKKVKRKCRKVQSDSTVYLKRSRKVKKVGSKTLDRNSKRNKTKIDTSENVSSSLRKKSKKEKLSIKEISDSSSDDMPLSTQLNKKTKKDQKTTKKVHFELPTTNIKSDSNSETDSAFTESDIEMDFTDNKTYSHNNKYNRDKFETRKISMDRLQKNRELDKRSREFRKRYKCETCIKGFAKNIEYTTHLERFHSEMAGPYKCPICSIRFSKESRMKQHYNRHLQSYNCRKCHFFHHSISAMYVHDKRRHGDGSKHTFICRHCAKEFPTPATLSYHVKRNHARQQWNAVSERKPKKKSYFIRKHEYDPDKLPRCRVCGKTFLNKSYLIKHERSHAQPPPRQERECPHCGVRVRFLEAHIRKVHERNENAYCAECDIQFSSVFSYRHSHLKFSRRHNPEPDTSKRTIPCPYCDKKWSHQRDLDRHVILIHTKEYPFICDLCGKGFYFERLLRNHVAEKHEGIPKPKDKICTYCGKAFVHLQVLKQHIRVHTGEKPYECAHCPWKFTQRTSLVTHMKGKHPEHFGKTIIRKKKRQDTVSSGMSHASQGLSQSLSHANISIGLT